MSYTREVGDKMSEDIRDNLKSVIKDKGFIQASVARRANISASKLSQILSKERKLEANEMFSICEAVEMTPMELKAYKPRLPDEKGA
jgi:transcriptional regulator with XRE-family HTH domain